MPADLDDLALVVGRLDVEFRSYPVERDDEDPGRFVASQVSLPEPGRPDIVVALQRYSSKGT